MRALVVVSIGLALVGCTRERGDGQMGDPCRSDFDCARGYCVAGVSGHDPVCTITCGRNGDCPDGWSCSGVTERGVVVCSLGASTPFGY